MSPANIPGTWRVGVCFSSRNRRSTCGGLRIGVRFFLLATRDSFLFLGLVEDEERMSSMSGCVIVWTSLDPEICLVLRNRNVRDRRMVGEIILITGRECVVVSLLRLIRSLSLRFGYSRGQGMFS